VGIDPGKTTAVAVLDLDGNLISLFSKKNLTKGEISRHILGYGRPVMIATDRSPAPSSVEKMAAVFSARLVEPEENLFKREKNSLARDFMADNNGKGINQHEKDALASAIYAYNTVKPTMIRVRHKIRALGHGDDTGLKRFVKTRIILDRDHVKRAIDKYFESLR
jgi:predicted RNase H-like nuclease (RuvC/YqgF family)